MSVRIASVFRALQGGSIAALLILFGCTTPPAPEPDPGPEPPFRQELLSLVENGYAEGRTGMVFPMTLPGTGLMLAQAWEYQNRIVGIEYRPGESVPEVALTPITVPESIREAGTVTANTYPAGYEAAAVPAPIAFSGVLELTGLGHGISNAEEEFWAYQRKLEEANYNLWKLVRLTDSGQPANVYHSLLVLRKLSADRSDAIVVTLGRVEEAYVLVTLRKFVRSREELDAFGRWASDVHQGFGLRAN